MSITMDAAIDSINAAESLDNLRRISATPISKTDTFATCRNDEDYLNFLHAKVRVESENSFDVEDYEVNPILKMHQIKPVVWAIRGGRRER